MIVTTDTMDKVKEIISQTEIRLTRLLRVPATLTLATDNNKLIDDEIQEAMNVVAHSLFLSPSLYARKLKEPTASELRKIATLLIIKYFPTYGVANIGKMMGKHHTTIIHQRITGTNLLETNDERFTEKFNIAEKAFKRWLSGKDNDVTHF